MNKVVFIAMPFNTEFETVYRNAILPAIFECNLEPLRVDELKKNNPIIQDIENGIKSSIIVIADLTNKNPNVFYEVGYARSLGKNIIPATQNISDLPFDLKDRRSIAYKNTDVGLLKFKNEIIQWINEILKNPNLNLPSRVFLHGTKFEVPNRHDFWNDLFSNAEKKFYLLGGTNKSWINRSEEQSEEFSSAIVKIISNGGRVKIISNNLPSTIKLHFDFYQKYIKKKLRNKTINNKFKTLLTYGTVENSNYKAVISDDRIVLLPTMNSEQFKDESLVMELEGSHHTYFKSYLADIDRLFKENKCLVIDLTSDDEYIKYS